MKKTSKLKNILKSLQKVLLAYSGGVDSTLLLKVALDTLGKENVLAIIAKSETYPKSEEKEAVDTAKRLDTNFIVIKTCEFSDKNFIKNSRNRCYYCKKELFIKLKKIAEKEKIPHVIDGSNKDDLQDYRPGAVAKKELGVRSPLQEAGLTKEEIRQLSKSLGLATWNKPAYACLASRVPYGTKITKEILTRIDEGEKFLREMGLRQVRARDHGNIVRIEVGKEDMSQMLDEDLRDDIARKFELMGYTYVAVDLQGYRAGSMNTD